MTYHSEWIEQAARDLDVAKLLLTAGKYEWAAYAGQQAAEKAAKALRILLGTDVGDMKIHDMNRLLGTIPTLDPSPDPLLARVGELDVHNQQARYPGLRGNAPGPQAPFRTYSQADADAVVLLAAAVVNYARAVMPAVSTMWAARAPAPAAGGSAPPSTTP